jgi:hypothetical protein
MTETDNVTLTKAGVAFGVLESWLLSATPAGCSTDASTLNICSATMADGSSAHILWMTNGQSSYAVPLSWQATSIQDVEGIQSSLGETLTVTESPVFLR